MFSLDRKKRTIQICLRIPLQEQTEDTQVLMNIQLHNGRMVQAFAYNNQMSFYSDSLLNMRQKLVVTMC